MKFLNVPLFIISLSIGLFLAYITAPSPEVIYVYPTPENVDKILYKDYGGTCYKLDANEVSCPNDSSKIHTIPAQNGNK